MFTRDLPMSRLSVRLPPIAEVIVLPKIDEEDNEKTRALGPQQASALAQQADPDELRPGTQAGAYVLERSLASGGGGTVYEAKHKLLGRRAAVKILRRELAASPQMVKRFLREAQAANLIKHPNIVDIYEFGELPDGRPFYVMELLRGADLRSLLTARGRFAVSEALEILEPVCSALEAAHAHGIIHRDLKASNIHVEERAGGRFVKLLDFGIAKLVHPDADETGLTVAGTRLGTAYTMAPEQIRGATVDQRTDIYALGVVLFHLLTGQYPFRAEHMTDIERMHLEAPVPRPSHLAPLSPAIDAVVLRAMEKDPDRRFPTVKAFAAALREAAGGARPRANDSVGRAIALYVEVRVPSEALSADSDEVLDDVSATLDWSEQVMREGGWQIVLQTGNALLGARMLPTTEDELGLAIQDGRAAAQCLADELYQRPTAHPDVHVNICVHVADAETRDSSDVVGRAEIAGGNITAIGDWAPRENIDGVFLSAPAR
jgi:serine/threonine protein kinase